MSYTRSFSKTVTVSGSVRVSYPASEHGGTTYANYTEIVPVNINVFVDTDDFDGSVNHVNNTVDILTGAIATTETAECYAINQSANQISTSIVDGFYKTIRSNVTMQKAEKDSELKSKVALLLALTKDMKDKYNRMNDDIAKLKRHYATVFSSLDNDLQKRIKELDVNTFDLNQARERLISVPFKSGVSMCLSQANENQNTNSLLVSARLKKKTANVLKVISNSIIKKHCYTNSMGGILSDENINRSINMYIPVMYCAYKDDEQKFRTYVPEMYKSKDLFSAVTNYMTNVDEESWKPFSDDSLTTIGQNLISNLPLGSDDNRQKRINEEILRMWNNSKKEMKRI